MPACFAKNFPAILPLLLLVMPSPVLAETQCPIVARHQFTSGIYEREPVDTLQEIRKDLDALWFFMEIHQGAGSIVTVHWHIEGRPDATVNLPVGTDRWRTWSSRQLGDHQDLPVDLPIFVTVTRDDCDLGTFRLSPSDAQAAPDVLETLHIQHDPPTDAPLIKKLKQLLSSGDTTAFRIGISELEQEERLALESPLKHLESRVLPLAQLERDIAQNRLYIARARIEPLRQKLADYPALLEQLQQAEKELDTRSRQLNTETGTMLAALSRVFAQTPLGAGPCPENDKAARKYWNDINPGLPLVLVSLQHSPEPGLLLLDQRTGKTQNLSLRCQTSLFE